MREDVVEMKYIAVVDHFVLIIVESRVECVASRDVNQIVFVEMASLDNLQIARNVFP